MELMCYNASISVHVTYFVFFGCISGESDDSVIQISLAAHFLPLDKPDKHMLDFGGQQQG